MNKPETQLTLQELREQLNDFRQQSIIIASSEGLGRGKLGAEAFERSLEDATNKLEALFTQALTTLTELACDKCRVRMEDNIRKVISMDRTEWEWADFNYLSLKNGMDSRRAAFLLYDFLNMFGIEKFQIVSSNGNFQNQSISIVYQVPEGYTEEQVSDKWYEHIKELGKED